MYSGLVAAAAARAARTDIGSRLARSSSKSSSRNRSKSSPRSSSRDRDLDRHLDRDLDRHRPNDGSKKGLMTRFKLHRRCPSSARFRRQRHPDHSPSRPRYHLRHPCLPPPPHPASASIGGVEIHDTVAQANVFCGLQCMELGEVAASLRPETEPNPRSHRQRGCFCRSECKHNQR